MARTAASKPPDTLPGGGAGMHLPHARVMRQAGEAIEGAGLLKVDGLDGALSRPGEEPTHARLAEPAGAVVKDDVPAGRRRLLHNRSRLSEPHTSPPTIQPQARLGDNEASRRKHQPARDPSQV